MAKSKGDIHWMVPGKKKPIAYSTKATSDLIVILSETNKTIADVYSAINYDQDATGILQKYIDLGYGNEIAKEWFK
jgi:hypothetical protein